MPEIEIEMEIRIYPIWIAHKSDTTLLYIFLKFVDIMNVLDRMWLIIWT